MKLTELRQVDGRYGLSNELHARPFPQVDAASQAVCLAFRPDPEADTGVLEAHLSALLWRNGAAPHTTGSPHYYGQVGRIDLKWERHTEFATYTFIAPRGGRDYFELATDMVPSDWLESLPGALITSCVVEVESMEESADEPAFVDKSVVPAFVRESLAVSQVLDGTALIAGDFRVDAAGFVRFFLLARGDVGSARIGRITQRLIEIEIYKAMAMLALPEARAVSAKLAEMDTRISGIAAKMTSETSDHNANLDALLEISAELEALAARHSSRFSAAEAYGAIVDQRIDLLREERYRGRQTLREFMVRRFDPAMRTCTWTSQRMSAMATRASRAGDMLRTRIGVRREKQNARILESMNERAAQQLKLQETVEGLSVIAISYYAVGLLSYLVGPMAAAVGVSGKWVTALLVVPVVLVVWWMVKRIRRSL